MTNAYANYEWFLKEDLNDYAGKWLAIIDKKVVASGAEVNQVIQEVNKKIGKPIRTQHGKEKLC